ncbi:hypothetical protein MtrunA17_Chr8g0373551 [Medicago truncatula]|uniref:Uncharacterized protein n=1 Tax=Medicago truncatula TaxID=3880 RepID=I3SJP4_MEDTR|nr:unknown [Medicago truncatula]RHN42134.1 hypothetical protein MtrunA17_Chr8g0373551 [Medicago truncatula]
MLHCPLNLRQPYAHTLNFSQPVLSKTSTLYLVKVTFSFPLIYSLSSGTIVQDKSTRPHLHITCFIDPKLHIA